MYRWEVRLGRRPERQGEVPRPQAQVLCLTGAVESHDRVFLAGLNQGFPAGRLCLL